MTTKPRTTAHAATVSKVLREAGCTKAEEHGTAVRGYRRRYAGFKVIKPANWVDEGKVVHVEHQTSNQNFTRGNPGDRNEEIDARLARYARVLREAGFTVTYVAGRPGGNPTHLDVTPGKDA